MSETNNMKIKKLEIKGFRSLKNVVWEPGDLNVLIGPNASGKTNLFLFLKMLSAAARKKGLSDYIQESGGINAISWDGAARTIEAKLRTASYHHSLDPPGSDQLYELRVARLGVTGYYQIESESLGNHNQESNKITSEPGKWLARDGSGCRFFDHHGEPFQLLFPKEISKEETLLPYSVEAASVSGNSYMSEYQEQLKSWQIQETLRTNMDSAIRGDSMVRRETTINPDGQNLQNVLHTHYTEDREFKSEIDGAMSAAFGDDYDGLLFLPGAAQRTYWGLRWKSLKSPQFSASLSDGTLRFLYLIAILANPDPPPLIAIDEPELGLHPSMLEIVAEFAVQASERTQVVLTTHSPEFLSAFRDDTPTTTVFELHDGETKMRTLSEESLDYWLKHYSLGKLFRTGELEDME